MPHAWNHQGPPGTKCYVHIKPHKHDSWGYHATPAWYHGPKLDQYWCYEVLVQKTGAVHTSDTVTFDYHAISLPPISNLDQILKAAKHLRHVINHAHLTNSVPTTIFFSCSSTPLMLCLCPLTKMKKCHYWQNPIVSPHINASLHSTWWGGGYNCHAYNSMIKWHFTSCTLIQPSLLTNQHHQPINNILKPHPLHHELTHIYSTLSPSHHEHRHNLPSPPCFVGTITDEVTWRSLKYKDLIKLDNYHDLWTDL